MKIRVYYEDTDTGGVVYHSNYLNFCERSRSEAFFNIGMTPELESGHFVARKLTADYFSVAKLGDILEVKNSMVAMKSASFTLKQEIYKNEKKIFSLQITLAYITFKGKPQRLDPQIKELILAMF
ncbi:YbgC/FadM family acyl-CoA thioesterase [Sulfurimonas sp. SAG-AH-194-I05]|nr:YbgC/FadM family acyl-CoA thioesterase [Sulfurimonas sp. SAG-AH-194-I05]MDF1875778.1 YbgC/FadM family acyl-CoA thioesterase [Sulfurimonas sp. SAG-AH-194-I05]